MRSAPTLAVAPLLLLAFPVAAVELPARGTDQIAHLCLIAFGGLERWSQIRDARYTQVSVRYGPGNRPARETSSQVYLRYQPRRQCRIESFTREGLPHLLVYDGERVRVEVDGREQSDALTQRRALRSGLSALYLFALPFNLKEPGVVLTYRGEAKIEGRKTYRLHAAVRRGSTPSPADTYEFFVDAESFKVPQLVYTEPAEGVTYIVRWLDYRNVDGVLRPGRWDYMASPHQKALSLELRDLKLNTSLPDSLFETRASGRRPLLSPAPRGGKTAAQPRN